MFQEIKMLSENRACFLFDEHIHFVDADMSKQWEFAGKVAKIVKTCEPALDRMVQRAETNEDVQAFVEAQNLLNRIMSDAYWYATKAYNSRDNCGLIHRFEAIKIAEKMAETETQ